MLSKIFRPKWQHRKVEVRLSALRDLEAADPILLQVAREDVEPAVRQLAVRMIDDMQSLFQLLELEPDESVRETCSKRLKRLLAGQEEELPLALRLQGIGRCAEEEILAYVMQHALEEELRRAALAAVSRPALLAEVALNDASAALRLAALERIARRATLERVAREARGKDKQIARRAREMLEEARTAELRPQRQRELCEAMEAVVQQGGVDLVAFRRLSDEWEGLLPPAEPEVGERFARASGAFDEAQARIRAEAAMAARQREVCERMEQLLREMEGELACSGSTDSAITMLERAWASLEEELPSLNPGLRERFRDALAQARQRCAEQMRRQEELATLQPVLRQLESMLEAESWNALVLQRLEEAWQAAGGGRKQAHTAALCERFASLRQQARHALAAHDEAAQALQQEYARLLQQMERALGEGAVQQASACRDKLSDREKKLSALGQRPSPQQQRRLKQANARLRELRDWRRFGTDNAREELLERLGELKTTPLEPLKQAEAIKALRSAWQKLDKKDGIAAESLWQAFDQAAEEAYAPCREHFEAQARQRGQNLQARRQFIEELEQAFEAVDWQQPDWAAQERQLQQAKKRWPKLGGVGRSDWEEVNARFNLCLAAYEKHLSGRRESEKQRREALIGRVEALAEEPELDKALAATREAQACWRPEVSCSQRVEQALWRRFKAACDAVYARQRAKADAHRRQEQEQLAALQQLCEQAEALALEAAEQPERVRRRMAELQPLWRELAGQTKRRNKALQQRFDAAQAAIGRAEEASRQRKQSAIRGLLLKKAALCDALEALLFGEAPAGQLEALLSAWQALQPLPDSALEQALGERFGRALALLQSGGEAAALTAAAPENLARRQALCLQLEILAGVDSPAELAEERLAMQVQLLAGAMTGQMGGEERQGQLRQLLEEYCLIGPVPPTQSAALQARLEAVIAAQEAIHSS